MALYFHLADLVRATLPQGQGWVGLVGVDPSGQEYHVLCPVDLDQACNLLGLTTPGQARLWGGRAGWLYRLCPPYAPPPPRQGRPPAAAFGQARAAQALATGRDLLVWAGLRGWLAALRD